MSRRLGLVAGLLLLLGAVGVACTDYSTQNEALRALLPAREGYRWVYSGTAEYGHSMELAEIVSGRGSAAYKVNGLVDDPSGGEAPGPFEFSLVYEVKQGRLTQTLSSGSRVLDNRFPQMELLRAPLRQGASWTQNVKDKDGKQVKLNCSIAEVTDDNGQAVYRVRYEDTGSDYWEERVIRQGAGVVAVELLYQAAEDFTLGYALYDRLSGYPEQRQLNSLLPPYDQLMRYFGLAEYGHSGTLHPVSETSEQKVVEFVGAFEDGSGIPGAFTVQYTLDFVAGTVTEQVRSNSRSGKAEVNSLMHDPVVLKLPLEQGNKWEQVVRIGGEERTMRAEVVEVGNSYYGQPQDRPVIRVKYQVAGVAGYFRDTYLEERVYQSDRGMIGFSRLLPGDIGLTDAQLQNEQLVQETLQQFMFGYSMDLAGR